MRTRLLCVLRRVLVLAAFPLRENKCYAVTRDSFPRLVHDVFARANVRRCAIVMLRTVNFRRDIDSNFSSRRCVSAISDGEFYLIFEYFSKQQPTINADIILPFFLATSDTLRFQTGRVKLLAPGVQYIYIFFGFARFVLEPRKLDSVR